MTGPLGLALLSVAGVLGLTCLGLGGIEKRWIGPLNLVVNFFSSAPFALAFLLSAWGWGRWPAHVLCRDSTSRNYIQLGLGVALLLTISHLLGVFGLLSAGLLNEHALRARLVGWSVVAIGLIMLGDQVARTTLRPERWPVLPRSAWLLAPGLVILIVAASNAPGGALWRSEFGAYDALSYHLQLPKEWGAGKRLWPVDHNIYSFLPSYVEAGFLHLATLMPGPNDPLMRMVWADGFWILACQHFTGMLAVAAAITTGRCATVACRRCGVSDRRSAFLGVLAGALVMSTPWVVVTGSLPYTEPAVLLLFASGMLVGIDGGSKPWARGVAAGLLAGGAVSCKPTAAFLCAPAIGLALLAGMPARAWVWAIVGGTIAGCAVIAPWLIRNEQAAGNPVFPFAAEQLGMGHWTLEQVARYARAHLFTGSILERLGRLFSAQFGLRHDQWSLTIGLIAASTAGALLWRPSHKAGALWASAILTQAVGWALLTHLQSRFLLPVIVPTAVLFALMGAALLCRFGERGLSLGGRGLAGVALAAVPLASGSWLIAQWALEDSNEPNRMLAIGPAGLTGYTLEERVRQLKDDEAEEQLRGASPPVAYINTVIRPQETAGNGVYLLGDSAPLYVIGASGLPAQTVRGQTPASSPRAVRSPVYYHTTWDSSPLGRFMLEYPDQPARWSDALRALGVRYVLVNFEELRRLIERDHNYDPNVTLRRVIRWIDDPAAGLVRDRDWPLPGAMEDERTGTSLFRLAEPGTPRRNEGGFPHGVFDE